MIATTIEQSKKLLELGLDPNTADMYYRKKYNEYPEVLPKDMMVDSVSVLCPCWSLSALLDLMPNVINLNGIAYRQQEFKTKNSYCYCYADERFPISFHGQPIDAAFEMVCWLKEKNLL